MQGSANRRNRRGHLAFALCVTVLTDASLSIGTILVDEATDRFSLSKTGWFLLTDEGTRA